VFRRAAAVVRGGTEVVGAWVDTVAVGLSSAERGYSGEVLGRIVRCVMGASWSVRGRVNSRVGTISVWELLGGGADSS